MSALHSVPHKLPGIVARRVGDEYILVPVTDNIADMTRIYTLNDTGAFVWDSIDGISSGESIALALAREYGVEPEVTRADVEACLADLVKHQIISA